MASQSPSLAQANDTPAAIGHVAVMSSNAISEDSSRQNTIDSTPAFPRSASQETQNFGFDRIKPVRAVFHDLSTAHSSITSGSARTGARALSNNRSEVYEEDDNSILLQELTLPKEKRKPTLSPLHKLPLPPPLATIAQHRYSKHSINSDHCLVAEDEKFVSHQQRSKPALPIECSAQPNSVFANVKNPLSYFSSRADDSAPSKWLGSSREKGKQRAQYPVNVSSVYNSSVGATPSRSLPLSSHPQSRPRKHGYDSYNDTIPFPDPQSTPPTNDARHLLPGNPPKAKGALSQTASSLPEGSTVGNIYKHYARSETLDDVDSDCDDAYSEYNLVDEYHLNQNPSSGIATDGAGSASQSNDQQYQSALTLRKRRGAQRLTSDLDRQPPGYALPVLPGPGPGARIIPSPSQGIGNSSSYGDTRNLLEYTERSRQTGFETNLVSSKNKSHKRSDQVLVQMDSTSQPKFSYLSPANPFRANHKPQLLLSRACDKESIHHSDRHYNGAVDRQPLEREVSDALRRASNFSAYSNGSIATSVLEHYRQFQSNASNSNGTGIFGRHIENSPPSESDIDEETRVAAAQAQAFYDRGAIPSNWIAASHRQENMVRIPIIQNSPLPNSPPISPESEVNFEYESHESPESRSLAPDDGNDWETVGESAFGTEFKSDNPGMLGANRAGSSIANTSDEGTISTDIPEIDIYGSTERIAQHPGHIKYFGDYRQRDLKNTNIPVFLPVFREHKVNGYLADSNRIHQPINPFNYVTQPLNRKHINPFKSPPPEFMKASGNTGAKPYTSSNRDRRAPKPNHFPPSASIKTNISSEDSIVSDLPGTKASLKRRAPPAESSSKPFDWMDEFGDPGPVIKYSNENFLKPIPPVAEEEDRPSSWAHIMTFARGDVVPGYNTDGTRIVDSHPGVLKEHSVSNIPSSTATNVQDKFQTDGFIETKTYGGKKHSRNQRERSTLVKGPPGAFYHGLCRPKSNCSRSYDTEGPAKVKVPYRQSSAKDYPTNVLRPLSLVPNQQRTVTPINQAGRKFSEDDQPNDFVYRSPLAPPKRPSWQKLYTQEQMTGFHEAAKADGIIESQESQSPMLGAPFDEQMSDIRDSIQDGGSHKHLWETPHLFQWPRESSARTDLARKKSRISTLVLCLCNLFPPLLLLYALGLMDGIIAWWTSGEFVSFGKWHKRSAYILIGTWGVVMFCGLVAFLVYWFTNPHS